MLRLPTRSRALQLARPGATATATASRALFSTSSHRSADASATIGNTTGGSHQQTRGQHAVSNPTLANIEKRWEAMPPQEQAELWMALRDRMMVDWHQMTLQEKRASYWIAFGPHGPRAGPPPGEGWQVFRTTFLWVAGSLAVFGLIRHFARDPPKTMTKEWQEMSNEYLKKQKADPITGLTSEGYTGPGMVQSPPGLDKYKQDDDE